MRRDSSTVVALVGEVNQSLLAEVGRSPNVAAVGGGQTHLDAIAQTLRVAASKAAPYVLVTADPLAEVAAGWQAMWNLSGGDPVHFEASAAELLTAWQAGRLDLPDYYVVVASDTTEQAAPDLHLGPLRSARPRRVEVAAAEPGPEQAAAVRNVLGHLLQSPWWPPLDELIDTARHFFPGGGTTLG